MVNLFDEDWQGSRWAYGFRLRPPGVNCQPDQFLIGSNRKHPDFRYGTLDYPRLLTDVETNRYELAFVSAIVTLADVRTLILRPGQAVWQSGASILVQMPHRSALMQVSLTPNDQGLYPVIELPRLTNPIDLPEVPSHLDASKC